MPANEFYEYFNDINENKLKLLEANFVSRLPANDFIFMNKEQQQSKNKLNAFVMERSRSIAAQRMQNIGKKTFRSQSASSAVNIGLLQRGKIQSQNESGKYKSQHSLNYSEFLSVMKQVLQIPIKVSTAFFAKLCIPKGNERNTNYNQLVDPNNPFYQSDIANTIFSGCQIYWLDVLNVLTSKTTFVQAVSEVKLVPKRTPKAFSHRLIIDYMQCVEELGCYFTSSRDGLVQFWAGEHLNPKLRFQLIDDMDFGLKDGALEYICGKYHDLLDDPAARKTKINVMAKVREGEIPLSEIKDIEQERRYLEGLPYTTVQTLTNPDHDASYMHIMQKGKQVEKVSLIIRACRAADNPLQSQRPLPDRVARTRNYENKVYLCDQFDSDEEDSSLDSEKQRKLSAKRRIVIGRSTSTPVGQFKQKSLDELYAGGFRDDERLNTNDFAGRQHPIFGAKAGTKQRFRRGLYKTPDAAVIFKKEEKPISSQSKAVCQNNNNWATCCCYYGNQMILATTSSKLLFYQLTYKAMELRSYMMVDAIGIKQLIVWRREIHSDAMQRLGGPGHVAGCAPDELPRAGQKSTIQDCLIFVSAVRIGVLSLKTLQEIGSVTMLDVCNHQRQSSDYFFEASDDDGPEPDREELQDMFFTGVAAHGDRFYASTSGGLVLGINVLDFRIDFTKRIFRGDVSALVYGPEQRALYVGGMNSILKVYQAGRHLQLLSQMRDSGCVLNVHPAPAFDALLSVCNNGVITVWHARHFHQMAKAFLNEPVSASAWDPASAALIVANVALRAFKLVGVEVKKQDQSGDKSKETQKDQQNTSNLPNKQQKVVQSTPQAHFAPVIGFVSIEQEKPTMEDLGTGKLRSLGILGKIGEKDTHKSENSTEVSANTSALQKLDEAIGNGLEKAKYKKQEFTRPHLDYRLMNTALPNQPPYVGTSDKVPFVDCHAGDGIVLKSTLNYSRYEQRLELIKKVALPSSYAMLDFGAYVKRVYADSGVETRAVPQAAGSKYTSKHTTGIEILQVTMSGADNPAQKVANSLFGHISVDSDGNLRHWGLDGNVTATYRLEVAERTRVVSVAFSYQNRLLAAALSDGSCIYFDVLTYQLINTIKPSACAKAAYLLSYDGQTFTPGTRTHTKEFQEFLKAYKPEDFDLINDMTVYQGALACAVGKYVLLFNLVQNGSEAQQMLSKRLVEQLLLQNSQQAAKLATGVAQPPQMILTGHKSAVVALDAVGRKLVTADDDGVICCWMGQGIPKQVAQIKKDQIKSITAMQSSQYWCAFLLKDGTVGFLDKNADFHNVLKLAYDGVSTRQVIFEKLSEDSLKAEQLQFKMMIVDENNLIVMKITMKTEEDAAATLDELLKNFAMPTPERTETLQSSSSKKDVKSEVTIVELANQPNMKVSDLEQTQPTPPQEVKIDEMELNNIADFEVLGYFQLPCGCSRAMTCGFSNEGNAIFIGDKIGHCFALSSLVDLPEYDYITGQQFEELQQDVPIVQEVKEAAKDTKTDETKNKEQSSANLPEIQQNITKQMSQAELTANTSSEQEEQNSERSTKNNGSEGQIQYLYKAIIDKKTHVLHFERNPDYDPRFDAVGLLKMTPLKIAQATDEDQEITTIDPALIKPQTKEFLANLRDIDNIVLEDKKEELYTVYRRPKSVHYSANYVQEQMDRIYQLDKELRLGLGSTVK